MTARRRPWGRTHGTIAVAALLLSALDHLATAIIGCPPVAWMTRRVAAPIAAAYRSAAWRSAPIRPTSIVTIRTPDAPERNPHNANSTR